MVSHMTQGCLVHHLVEDRPWVGHKGPVASPEAASLAAAYQELCEEQVLLACYQAYHEGQRL